MRKERDAHPIVDRSDEKIDNSEVRDDSHGNDDDDSEDGTIEKGLDTSMTETEHIDRRDEVGEVRKMSSKDTKRLRLWRLVVTGVILLTAFAVTFTTYTLLENQENENFQTAVRCLWWHNPPYSC
jgi:hypothetical protein